ncbi:MAG: DUF3419 family protein [Synechococcaceae cyanobacterium]|nr:DUF3419 family protein [Synechococcaceae cyanobacterium]
MAADDPRRWRLLYGQCWEDADRLLEGLGPVAGRPVLSIASGGDNSLALLAGGPSRLIAIDSNPAQIALLQLKLAAITTLDQGPLLEFLGARGPEGLTRGERGRRRLMLYGRCRPGLPGPARRFWDTHPHLIACGVLRAGRFERYLDGFRRWLLPLAASGADCRALLDGLAPERRRAWLERCRGRWSWQLLFRLYFSRAGLGLLGTTPAQVRHGRGDQGAELLGRLDRVLLVQDPAANPYLEWLLSGSYGRQLPAVWQEPTLERIRRHATALECRVLSLQDWLQPQAGDTGGAGIAAFNLSNVFDYLPAAGTSRLLGQLRQRASADARLLCWNRQAERDTDLAPPGSWQPRRQEAEALLQRDRVFFYRRLVLAEALPQPPPQEAATRLACGSPGAGGVA